MDQKAQEKLNAMIPELRKTLESQINTSFAIKFDDLTAQLVERDRTLAKLKDETLAAMKVAREAAEKERSMAVEIEKTVDARVAVFQQESIEKLQTEQRLKRLEWEKQIADMNAKPQPGHTLVIEKDGGRGDVRKMNATGGWAYVRDDLATMQTAWEIARNALDRGCRVWYRHESHPDTAIRLY